MTCPILRVTSRKNRSPLSTEADFGSPMPVSSLTFDHFRSVHSQPSEKALILCRFSRPAPQCSLGSTRSGLRCSITLVSSSSAWSPGASKISRPVQRLKPVGGTQQHGREFQTQLPQHGLEIVASMAVQNQELMDMLPVQYPQSHRSEWPSVWMDSS